LRRRPDPRRSHRQEEEEEKEEVVVVEKSDVEHIYCEPHTTGSRAHGKRQGIRPRVVY
jgi:hypothetical protein